MLLSRDLNEISLKLKLIRKKTPSNQPTVMDRHVHVSFTCHRIGISQIGDHSYTVHSWPHWGWTYDTRIIKSVKQRAHQWCQHCMTKSKIINECNVEEFDLECRVGILSFLITFEEIYENGVERVAWRAPSPPPFPIVSSWYNHC